MVRPLYASASDTIDELPASEKLDRDSIDVATTSLPGLMSGADKASLDGTPAAITSAVAAETAARTAALAAHVGVGGSQHPDAVAGGNAGFLSGADKTKLDSVEAGAEANDADNVGTSIPQTTIEVFKGFSGSTAQLRRIRGTNGIRASVDSNDLVHLDLDPGFASTYRRSPAAYSRSGSKVAGATLPPNLTGSVDPSIQGGFVVHDDQNLYPFVNWTEFDQNGYPHHLYNQMINNNISDPKQSRGYEDGDLFRDGELVLVPGRGVHYEVRGLLKNLGWTDAMVEMVLEPNPSVQPSGELEGTNRMRFLSDELGFLTSSDYLFTFWCKMLVRSALSWSWEGVMKIYSSTGALVFRKEFGNYRTSGMNWLEDVRLQLRWRVDRISQVDTYDGTYQGSNQGSNLLRLDMQHQLFQPIGFDPEEL